MDMSLISMKDGGRFALSWIAGTNAKALRTNSRLYHIDGVDIPDVCEQMMETIKSAENKLSFRILFRLCLGTIQIFAEQVQRLYNVTLNFVCFNTFMLKHLTRKRCRSAVGMKPNKRRRLTSSESVDFTKLLLESEIINNYSEEKFEFPQEVVNFGGGKTKNTSTCIQIQKITIRQISWDNPTVENEEEDAFGEASQDDQMMLLSQLTDTINCSDTYESNKNCRKRKFSSQTNDCPPAKMSADIFNESVDEVRFAPSTCDDSMSEFNVDIRNRSSRFNEEEIPSTHGELISRDLTLKNHLLNETRLIPENLSDQIARDEQDEPRTSLIPAKSCSRKRRSQLIIDRVTKIAKDHMETRIGEIWQNCVNKDKKEHIAKIVKYNIRETSFAKVPSLRFQSSQLLSPFKNNLKSKWKQFDLVNRQILLEEILGDECELFKKEFKLNSIESKKPCNRIFHKAGQMNLDSQVLQFDDNNNYPTTAGIQSNEDKEYPHQENKVLSLKCSLDQIDPRKISFHFPIEAETQRSEWEKEGILMKLLFAWRRKDPVINMRTIIVGANRIKAALAFHTLLDLAGQQYIEIVKDETNFIESIIMGPEMIRKINETC